MTNLCKECEKELFGRIDKKFCSDQCRTTFNNNQNRQVNTYVRQVNTILKKNRRILIALNPGGKTKLHRDKLVDKGFNFDYYTNQYITKKGKVYFFCYDQGYIAFEDNTYALVIRQSYLDK